MQTENDDQEPGPDASPRAGRWRLAALMGLALALFVLARSFPLGPWLAELEQRVAALGAFGPLVYGFVYVAASLLLVPAVAITLVAGPLFGLGLGTAVVSLASTTAAALAFLIARHAGRGAVERALVRRGGTGRGPGRLEALDAAVGRGGWRIVALLRLSPLVPFSLGNYLYGLTSIPFWPYVGASWVGMLPGTFLYVYLGYAGARGLEAASQGPGGGAGQTAQLGLLAVGLAATLLVTVYVSRLALRAVREASEAPHASGSPHGSGNRDAR